MDTSKRLLTCVFPGILAIAMLIARPDTLYAQIDVLTNRYDGARSGANLSETTLTTANVNVNQFGKLYSYPVDGAVYAQPLYVRNVAIGGTLHNVLYVVTMNDKAYAFDADGASTSPLWVRDFTTASVKPVPIADISSGGNIWGNVGIESTPVIDGASGSLYFVARTKEGAAPPYAYVQRLHAIDIATGAERPGSPVTIAASLPGSAPDATPGSGGSIITFDPKMQQQRAGLALTSGVVLVAWAGHEDLPPYHGWIMGFNATTLARIGAFAVSPDFGEGGIWQGGRAPTIDAAGNAFFATGNGKWDGTRNFGDSLLKFAVSPTAITLVDYFTPANEVYLDANDDDLSGSGFTLLPGTHLLLGGGKEGVLYLLNADSLGHKAPDVTQLIQSFDVNGGHVMGGPVFWNSPGHGPLVYNWSEDDVLVAYQFTGGQIIPTRYLQGAVRSPGHPGGSLTITSNGLAAGTGIVWASIPTNQNAKHILTAGTLRAYDADTLKEVWTSDQNFTRDHVGTLIKFVPPLVVNGRVYMATHDNAVAVYGILPPQFSVAATPAARAISPGTSATFSVSVGADSGFAQRVDFSATAPAGTTVTFDPSSVTGAGVTTMTVALGAGAPSGAFSVNVTGTSGVQVHSAPPVVINGPPEIVLYAKNASPVVGNWRVVADATAAGGARVEQPDAGLAKIGTALAAPVNYFELTFNAKAGTAYRLWMRARAQNNSYNNDSVYMQFSGSVTASGTAVNRIGTTQGVAMILEDCSGCGVAEWGWADNGYGVAGIPMYFTDGPQTLRVQGREDGISIDQIVVSPVLYLDKSPGATKNDATILAASPAPTLTIVRYAAEARVIAGNWRIVNDSTAAAGMRIEQPDAGVPKITTPASTPANYFELTFTAQAGTAYRLWIRGRAQNNSYMNDSVYVQFSGSVTSTGAPVNRIGTTEAATIVLEDCSGCAFSGWVWQDNGYGAGVLGPPMYFTAGTQTIRFQGREDGISIDQIVLSPDTYLATAPGLVTNDGTILTRTPE